MTRRRPRKIGLDPETGIIVDVDEALPDDLMWADETQRWWRLDELSSVVRARLLDDAPDPPDASTDEEAAPADTPLPERPEEAT